MIPPLAQAAAYIGPPPSCPACAAALTNPNAGIYQRGCPGCDVRDLAQQPKEYRRLRYEQERLAHGAEAAKDLQDAVAVEYVRVQRLRGML